MAVRMQQHQVLQLVTTALVPFNNVVDIPPGLERDVLLAHQETLFLSIPKRVQNLGVRVEF